MINRREFFSYIPASSGALRVAAGQTPLKIRSVDIVHHTHLDVGYTALPSVVRDDQTRYLDAAIDAAAPTRPFAGPSRPWSNSMTGGRDRLRARRGALQSLVQGRAHGRHGHALQPDRLPQRHAVAPDDELDSHRAMAVASAFAPPCRTMSMAFPRAGAIALLDHGVHHLLMGINADSGGPPFRRPMPFGGRCPTDGGCSSGSANTTAV